MQLPAIVADVSEHAARAPLEFFTARIPSAHTRKADGRAVFAFCSWCERESVSLAGLGAAILLPRGCHSGRTSSAPRRT